MTRLRIGHGIDTHRLVPGRALILGGVTVPHDRGLEGHSDGDVVVHALTSAVLGAGGLGDLGRHFPSDDPQWAGADSLRFLEQAAALLGGQGLVVVSAQVVAVCTAPRLGAHLDVMGARLSHALGVPAGTVTVGVTSTDGLGATGRGEGIAASAVVLAGPVS